MSVAPPLTSPIGQPSAPPPTPLQHAIFSSLRHPALVFFPHVPLPMVRRATAVAARGLDHVGNESLVAIAHENIEDKKGNAVVVTDRRIFGCSGQSLFSVPYSIVTGAQRRSDFLETQLHIGTGKDHMEIEASMATAAIEPLLFTLSQMPPELREVERLALATSTDVDPIGASQIKSKLLWPDTHTQTGVSFVERAHACGWLDVETAMNALKRVLILNRNHFMGRGMFQGAWISPCSTQDLAHGFVRIFGHPSWQGADGNSIFLDFKNLSDRFPKARDEVLSLSAAVRQSIDHARLTVAPLDQLGCSFKLETVNPYNADLKKPVATQNVRLWQVIDELLLPYETQITQLRTVLGWGPHAEELLAHGAAMASHRLAELPAP
jgi:hypothetical protein